MTASFQGLRSYDRHVPELPEVETIRRQLAPHLEGRTLDSVEINDFRWTLPAPPELIAAELTGARIERLGRRGKYRSGSSTATGTCSCTCA